METPRQMGFENMESFKPAKRKPEWSVKEASEDDDLDWATGYVSLIEGGLKPETEELFTRALSELAAATKFEKVKKYIAAYLKAREEKKKNS